METKFNFNSQVATSKVQSERLLALGLKKETADMYWLRMVKDYRGNDIPTIRDKWWLSFVGFTVGAGFEQYECIPAWSLHRLCILAATPLELDEMLGYIMSDYYDNVINHIESLIKRGYFPKEYLV